MASRNLVVFCDGTSNEVQGDLTNVLKLYRICKKDAEQIAFYDPGVGTAGLVRQWGRLRQSLTTLLGLATGWGLDEKILDAYQFLAREYRDGDRIYLFGFSRGSYTARALAGFIYEIGLLRERQLNLAGYALTAYKQATKDHSLKAAWKFRSAIDSRCVPIHFVGVWDTVASVIVPWAHGVLPALEFLPYTATNPGVEIVRHAASIDERRRMFRLYRWVAGQTFRPDRFSYMEHPQDAKRVWFAGDHSDIGGGYAEEKSAPAKFSLAWMAQEAEAAGLRLHDGKANAMIFGRDLLPGQEYVGPDAAAEIHPKVMGFWNILEYLPKRTKWRRWPARRSFLGLYLPRCEPRFIEDGASLHHSVVTRMAETTYRPENLPKNFVIEPPGPRECDAIEARAQPA